jgi:hypothetical protein
VKKAPDAEREASAFKREKFEFFLKEDEGNKVGKFRTFSE